LSGTFGTSSCGRGKVRRKKMLKKTNFRNYLGFGVWKLAIPRRYKVVI
jgi:hypothetical protein